MIQSKIIEDLVHKTGEAFPVDEIAVHALLRKITRPSPSNSRLWNTFESKTQAYLQKIIKFQNEKKPVPMPDDMKILEEGEVPFVGEEAIEAQVRQELLPEAMECQPNHMLMTLSSILDGVDSGNIQIPYFQRKFVWKPKEQESFIESFLSNIPVHSLMLAVDPRKKSAKYLIDGCQRVTTLRYFREGLTRFKKLKFEDLPPGVKQQFLYTPLPVTETITHREHWPAIFRRINIGGRPLNDIELRRVTYESKFIDDLTMTSEVNEHWKSIFGKNARHKGTHALLRACTMHLWYQQYRKPMTTFMDDFCAEIVRNPEVIPQGLLLGLDNVIMSTSESLGRGAFRMYEDKPIHLGVLDLVLHAGLVLLAAKPDLKAAKLGELIRKAKHAAISDTQVNRCLTVATTEPANIAHRMSSIENIVLSYLT